MIKYLIELEININKENKKDNTPLHFLYINNNQCNVKLSIEHGANINKKKIKHHYGRDINKVNKMNNTLLKFNSMWIYCKIIKRLCIY